MPPVTLSSLQALAEESEDDLSINLPDLLPSALSLKQSDKDDDVDNDDFEDLVNSILDNLLQQTTSKTLPPSSSKTLPNHIVSTIKAIPENPSILETSLAILRLLCADVATCDYLTSEISTVNSAVEADYEGEGTIVEQYCLIVSLLCASSSGNKCKVVESGCKEFVIKFQDTIVNERNKAYAVKALKALE